MKYLVGLFAIASMVAADVSHLSSAAGYNYPTPHQQQHYEHDHGHNEISGVSIAQPIPAPLSQYLPLTPVHHQQPAPTFHTVPSPAVHSAPTPAEYLSPSQDHHEAPTSVFQPIAPVPARVEIVSPAAEAEPAHELASDGYRYKTIKHYRFRYRY